MEDGLDILREIAEREKQKEIDEMVRKGADREFVELVYDKVIERLYEELDRKLLGNRGEEWK